MDMTLEFVLRIFVAALLGGAIGLEREYRAKEAGLCHCYRKVGRIQRQGRERAAVRQSCLHQEHHGQAVFRYILAKKRPKHLAVSETICNFADRIKSRRQWRR